MPTPDSDKKRDRERHLNDSIVSPEKKKVVKAKEKIAELISSKNSDLITNRRATLRQGVRRNLNLIQTKRASRKTETTTDQTSRSKSAKVSATASKNVSFRNKVKIILTSDENIVQPSTSQGLNSNLRSILKPSESEKVTVLQLRKCDDQLSSEQALAFQENSKQDLNLSANTLFRQQEPSPIDIDETLNSSNSDIENQEVILSNDQANQENPEIQNTASFKFSFTNFRATRYPRGTIRFRKHNPVYSR